MKAYKELMTEAKKPKGSTKITPAMKILINRISNMKPGKIEIQGYSEAVAAEALGVSEFTHLGGDFYEGYLTNSDIIRISNLLDTSSTPQEKLPSHVNITDRLWTGGLDNVIAVIKQKTAKSDQQIFPVDAYDLKIFGKGLKKDEVLVRAATPLTKAGSSEWRVIAKLNPISGKVAWLNQKVYEDSGKIKWERPHKVDYLTIDEKHQSYFGIW